MTPHPHHPSLASARNVPTFQRSNPPALIYRCCFTPEECAMLDATPLDDPTSEINLLRILLARVLAACRPLHKIALETHARILAAFSAAGLVIARLVRLQSQLHDPNDALWAEIERGKQLGRQRRHVYDYFRSPVPA